VKCFWTIVGNSLFNIVFLFHQASWVIRINTFFDNPPQKEVWGVRSGDRGGQMPRPTMRSPKNSCSKATVPNDSRTAVKISMRSNVREWTHILLVNTPCSQLHSLCASHVSSGLATRVTLTRVSRGRLGESIAGGWTCFGFHLCTVVRYFCWVAF
jgi:hypothetical protein